MAEATAVDQLELYGAECTIPEITQLVKQSCERNARADKTNSRREVLCLWGKHGIGKTALIKQMENDGYQVRDIPLAQFEEMGDLHGMPEIVVDEKTGRHITRQALPEWVPTVPGKGIILFDDWNRADGRIIKGIMQLLQDYRMVTWQIPAGWSIMLTANPDGGDYLVTTIDDATLTRIRHVTLVPDVEAWAQWATDNNVDRRGINFVLRHKEAITTGGPRTTPRTLTEFFNTLKDIGDLKGNLRMVEINALASLDRDWATTFMAFINSDMGKIVEANDIFDRFDEVKPELDKHLKGADGTMNLDVLGVVCSRVMFEAARKGFKPTQDQIKNFQKFLSCDFVPADKATQVLKYINKIQSTQRDSQAYTLAMSNETLLTKIQGVVN